MTTPEQAKWDAAMVEFELSVARHWAPGGAGYERSERHPIFAMWSGLTQYRPGDARRAGADVEYTGDPFADVAALADAE